MKVKHMKSLDKNSRHKRTDYLSFVSPFFFEYSSFLTLLTVDCKAPVSLNVQATKKSVSKARNGLLSQGLTIVLHIGSRWGSFGKFSLRKITSPCSTRERHGGSTVGMALRNFNTTHVWWDFGGINAGPQKFCCGWLQLH